MRITVFVKPGSRSTQVGGMSGGCLAVRVKERAVEGAANAGVMAAVAHAFGLKPRQVKMVQGRTSRRKVLDLEIGEETGAQKLSELKGFKAPMVQDPDVLR